MGLINYLGERLNSALSKIGLNKPVSDVEKKIETKSDVLKSGHEKEIDSEHLWFGDLINISPLMDSQKSLACKYAHALINGDKEKTDEMGQLLQDDRELRGTFLSVSDGNSSASVAFGFGQGIVSAINQAKKGLYVLISQQYEPKWIKLDIVESVSALGDVDFRKPLESDRASEGFAFSKESKLAFLPEEIVAGTFIATDQKLRMGNIRKSFDKLSLQYKRVKKLIKTGSSVCFRFTCASFFVSEKESFSLFRGHQLFSQLTKKELMESAEFAGDYLIKNVQPNGSFVYTYFPKLNVVPDTYNILRHAGSIYSMLELYELTRNEKLLSQAQKAIEFLLKQVKDFQKNGRAYKVVVEKDYIKLGGNALACLALVKYIQVTNDHQYLEIAKKLGDWVVDSQSNQGEFTLHKVSFKTGKKENFISGYYPGEAIFALTRLYQVDPNEQWLDVAEKAAEFLINIRDKNKPIKKLDHDHWLLYGLNELYPYRSQKIFVDHALKIVSAILGAQKIVAPYRDWVGGFYTPPRSTPTAVRAEGLCAAYQLLRTQGQSSEAERILNAIKLCICFQLQTQFRPENSMYVKKPERVLGGFSKSLSNFEVRIDYVQHNISALLGLVKIFASQ